MLDKLKEIARRFQEIEHLITTPEIINDRNKYSILMKERGGLSKYMTRYEELDKAEKQLAETKSLINDPGVDSEMKSLATEEARILEEKQKLLWSELEEMFIVESKEWQSNVIIEIRPGPGGDEAALFASEIFRMYTRFAERKGWKMEVIEHHPSGLGGTKQVIFSIEGEDVYKNMRFESGVHRVQRVPATEAAGRVHTSTCTVAVLPQAEEVDIVIRPEDLDYEAYRAGGPGGQNVNKLSTAVRIKHKPTGIVVACMTERSQHQNRDLAMTLLRTRILEQEVTKKKNERDTMRRSQIGTGDRSEKIRTYNFPQSRITDHRIGFSVHNMQEVMDGVIDELIGALQAEDRKLKLKALGGKKE